MPHFISAAPLGQLAALDVHQLYKLRVDVFVHEQRCPYAEIDATDANPQTVHLLAWDADTHELLGTARVFPAAPANDAALSDATPTNAPTTGAQIGRFALAPAARGTGLGRELLQAAIDLGERMRPGQPLYLEAQAGLVDYYASFGFTPTGEPFDDEGVPHQPMLRPAS
ncbi:GNAT family N-acetyltransferase [Corynebacterium marquesiae]|uniref:GNAT family N-acetyltransferase n=1 Tax=Corynebacterium marquesiae TaxID=2913503 RepID=UPI00254C7671|nr:GNAT family N-acetyltransferase [Corynebacterium marquesiae]MDK8455204.1 GNAT family N-acetyltransferase [Corynebacterium marquesiae]MDK8725351.1 GNAT family N-acetyltransferase [Corynebacterium marquesiae]MDK8770671.1 GNAT family N-acetyltransferase [Corynebacterium marquesiae]